MICWRCELHHLIYAIWKESPLVVADHAPHKMTSLLPCHAGACTVLFIWETSFASTYTSNGGRKKNICWLRAYYISMRCYFRFFNLLPNVIYRRSILHYVLGETAIFKNRIKTRRNSVVVNLFLLSIYLNIQINLYEFNLVLMDIWQELRIIQQFTDPILIYLALLSA